MTLARYYLGVLKGAGHVPSEIEIEADSVDSAAVHAMHMCELLRSSVVETGIDANDWMLVGRNEDGIRVFAINLSTVLSPVQDR